MKMIKKLLLALTVLLVAPHAMAAHKPADVEKMPLIAVVLFAGVIVVKCFSADSHNQA